MWGCNYYSDIPLIGPFLSHGLFSLILWGVFLFFIIFLIFKILNRGGSQNKSIFNDKHDSLEILRMRYANGEINTEEFNKIKQALL